MYYSAINIYNLKLLNDIIQIFFYLKEKNSGNKKKRKKENDKVYKLDNIMILQHVILNKNSEIK